MTLENETGRPTTSGPPTTTHSPATVAAAEARARDGRNAGGADTRPCQLIRSQSEHADAELAEMFEAAA
jgi:hypothetical protein